MWSHKSLEGNKILEKLAINRSYPGQKFDVWHASQKHTPNKNVCQVTYKV